MSKILLVLIRDYFDYIIIFVRNAQIYNIS